MCPFRAVPSSFVRACRPGLAAALVVCAAANAQAADDSARPTATARLAGLAATAAEAEAYVESHLFDPDGLMYSYIDVRTGKPFAEEYVRQFKTLAGREPWVPDNRANNDPVTYWSYEDTVAIAGMYIEALVAKHEVTGDPAPLKRAFAIWEQYRLVYYASQPFGSGGFLRPYGGRRGGFAGMAAWMEPLGTDQASCLLTGQYALWKHATDDQKRELATIMTDTLRWYERQGFRYVWYKSLIHDWTPGNHAASYYLPGIAFAARTADDADRWAALLRAKLPLVQGSTGELGGNSERGFKWGSDLAMLAELMGPDFAAQFPEPVIVAAFADVQQHLATFDGPGRTAPGPGGARQKPSELGFYFLFNLVALGHPGAAEKAADVLTAWRRVPDDFTVFVHEGHQSLPMDNYTQLQACAVGRPMVIWIRNYWLLRKALSKKG